MAEAPVGGGAVCAAAGLGAGEPSGEPSGGSALEQLGDVADAVLYEGYLLYPYRRSSLKNRVRWQFGVLFPRDWVERDGPVPAGISGSADSWYQQTECLLRRRRPDALVRVTVRYLQMQHKQIEEADRHGGHHPVESLCTDDGRVHLTFTEAVPHEQEIVVPLDALLRRKHTFAVGPSDGEDIEPLPGSAGRVVRRRTAVRATTTVLAEQVGDNVHRLRIRTENTENTEFPADTRAGRDAALRRALIATHTLIGGEGLEFLSLIDPPPGLERHARDCRNAFTFPVLGGAAAVPLHGPAGPPDTQAAADHVGRAVLSAPIILPDHPQVAPESPGDLHDSAEIDEILTLRTLLLTDEEKREVRATDRRAAEILDRAESMPPEVFSRLHGAIRSLAPAGPRAPGADTAVPAVPGGPVCAAALADRPAWWQEGADDGLSPVTDTVLIGGVPVGGGHRVRLHPRTRGTDAQDMFLAGRTARVAGVFHDVDGSVHLAVTVDDDPAAELHGWYGRFHYFRPDELEPLDAADTAGRARLPASPPPPPQSADEPENGRSDGRS